MELKAGETIAPDSLMQGISEILTNRSWVINDLLQQRLPTLTSFSVLVADLQDSIRICAELPPEEYFELVNSIWKCMDIATIPVTEIIDMAKS